MFGAKKIMITVNKVKVRGGRWSDSLDKEFSSSCGFPQHRCKI
jgi:hypothetical protein